MVIGAGELSPEVRREQFDRLVRFYRPPMIAYLQKRLRAPIEEADDVVNGFLVKKLLEPAPEDNIASRYLQAEARRKAGDGEGKSSKASAAIKDAASACAAQEKPKPDSSRIRFRDYLRRSLKNYYIDQRRKAGNDVSIEMLGGDEAAVDRNDEPDFEFDQSWAKNILRLVIEAVKRECDSEQQDDIWFVFSERILKPVHTGEPPATYEELCQTGRFKKVKDVANRYQTAIRKFDRLLKATVINYLPCGKGELASQIAAEIEDLRTALRNPELLKKLLSESSATHHSFDLHAHELLSLRDDVVALWNDCDLAGYWTTLLHSTLSDVMLEVSGGPSLIDTESPHNLTVTLRELIGSQRPQLAALKALKNAAKSAGQNSRVTLIPNGQGNLFPPAIAKILYSAAIAAARVRHNELITRVNDAQTAAKMDPLIKLEWIDEETRQLLRTWLTILQS